MASTNVHLGTCVVPNCDYKILSYVDLKNHYIKTHKNIKFQHGTKVLFEIHDRGIARYLLLAKDIILKCVRNKQYRQLNDELLTVRNIILPALTTANTPESAIENFILSFMQDAMKSTDEEVLNTILQCFDGVRFGRYNISVQPCADARKK